MFDRDIMLKIKINERIALNVLLLVLFLVSALQTVELVNLYFKVKDFSINNQAGQELPQE